MVYQLTKEEKKELYAIFDGYAKLIKESEEKIEALKPQGKEPPAAIKTDNKSEKEAKKALARLEKLHEEWLNSGSDEWREERKRRLELMQRSNNAVDEFMRSTFDTHFKTIAGEPDAIVEDAFQAIDDFIPRICKYYRGKGNLEDLIEINGHVDMPHIKVDIVENGYLLDVNDTIKYLTDYIYQRHIKGLKKDGERIQRIKDYIIQTVDESAFTSSVGGKPGTHETTEESILAVRPKNYVVTVDRVSKQLFKNELMKPVDSDPEALYDVRLDGKGKVTARVAIDYKELLGKGTLLELPELNEKDYSVHDAIITLLSAGNRVMSHDMIYRAMTGKVSGKITVPDEARKSIDEALEKFRGTFKLEYEYVNEDGETVVRSYDEPLVSYQRVTDRLKINGKVIAGAIRLSDDTKLDPPLLRWARENGNEIDTRDITLLDVPRLNNGDESFTIKMCLYRRLISMRNTFERKKSSKYELSDNQRTIRYDYIYAALGIETETLTKDKRHDVKDKIDRCMKYWEKKGFISSYEHKKDKKAGNLYYAVMVSFVPKG